MTLHLSIALIAHRGSAGCVLAFDGAGIEYFIECAGFELVDLGLDDAPDGLSIWEGRAEGHWTFERDYDSSLEGTFRSLTPEEWHLYETTGEPWEYEG